MKIARIAIGCGLFIGAASPAMANLFVNPGFETGNLTGWTLDRPNGSYAQVSNDFGNPIAGTYDLYQKFDTGPGTSTLSQTIVTQAGKTLRIRGLYRVEQPIADNTVTILFNGVSIFASTLYPSGTASTLFGATAIGTGNDTVSFVFTGVGNAFNVDSFSAAVPEPASWALLVGGFGVTGATMRRRRAVSANA